MAAEGESRENSIREKFTREDSSFKRDCFLALSLFLLENNAKMY